MAIRGTTPIVSIDATGGDFSGATVYVTLDQNGVQVTHNNNEDVVQIKRLEDADDGRKRWNIAVALSQSETLGFDTGNVEVQVRWIDADGHAYAEEQIGKIKMNRVLLEEVIRYNG